MPELNDFDWSTFVGRELGNVALLKELGRGVMGVVFTGFQKTLKRQVAVKVLLKSHASTGEAWNLFRDEGEALAVLNHPNIIPIYEMGETDDCYFQVMQLVEGGDLRSLIKRNLNHPLPSKRLIPLPETLDIVIQVLDGLGFAHEGGVIHQDVKPANILVENRNKRPLLADFGIARIFAAEYLSQGKIVGTPLYMSPEQASSATTDGRTDIYSMGVILFQMIVGTLPIKDESAVEMIECKKYMPETFFTKKPGQVPPGMDAELERIVLKSVEPDPGDRYAACQDFIEDLKKYRRFHLFRTSSGPATGHLV
jgi:serine/threonine-protein kinase